VNPQLDVKVLVHAHQCCPLVVDRHSQETTLQSTGANLFAWDPTAEKHDNKLQLNNLDLPNVKNVSYLNKTPKLSITETQKQTLVVMLHTPEGHVENMLTFITMLK